MNQVKQQASKLQSSFDDKLKAQTDKQKAVTAFIAKPVLLRLASDILSLTVSTVRQDAKRGASENSWDQPLNRVLSVS